MFPLKSMMMKEPTRLLFFFLLTLPVACVVVDHGQAPGTRPQEYAHALMFYNVENLFHPSDDTIPGDDDFTAPGVRHWSYNRYYAKLATLCKIILAVKPWEPPVLIGLCEVENERVLKDIIYHPMLKEYAFSFLHHNSNDHRGIDVALLYRPEKISCLSQEYISNCLPGKSSATREILHGTFLLEADTIDVFINHWTSKYGGAYETEEIRVYQAHLLSGLVDSILEKREVPRILLSGDFNDNSDSRSIRLLTQGRPISEVLPFPAKGSYKFQGKWDLIDHFFIAGKWSPAECSCSIFTAPYLLEEDIKYTGVKPFRTYAGFKYNGGISDHLPILLHFQFVEAVDQ